SGTSGWHAGPSRRPWPRQARVRCCGRDRKSTRLNSSHVAISYAVFCLKKKLAHCLKLIHFHVGSQVPDISTIKRAVREAARYYSKIAKLGHELEYLDVGGGLGVDYDGSRSTFDSSTNYSLQEYTNDVVWN